MPIDKQTIFNNAFLGVLKQGVPSVSIKLGMCAYRGDEGRKCAIGHSIADEEYTEEMEGKGISLILSSFKNNIAALAGADEKDISF